MSVLFALGAGLLAALLLWLLQRRQWAGSRGSRTTWQRQGFLLSPEERAFLPALREAIGGDYDIFGKVRIRDVLAPRSGQASPEDQARIAGHFSFVLCQRPDLAIACAVRLLPAGTGPRDGRLRGICQSAGLPVVEIEAEPLYDHRALRAAIAAAIRMEPLAVQEPHGRREPGFSGLKDLEL
jgi:hypothetical protein